MIFSLDYIKNYEAIFYSFVISIIIMIILTIYLVIKEVNANK